MSSTANNNRLYLFGLVAIVTLYLTSHLWNLLGLPVFADEAIYIRWSQLIIDDWRRYLFFPLNDGKTPFFMWLLVPFQFVFSDQLYAARFVSVLIGLGQIGAIVWVVRLFGGSRTARILAAIFVAILPFWFFHHRMALIDATLTLFLTVSLASLLEVVTRSFTFNFSSTWQLKKIIRTALYEPWLFVAGGFFGLALWTKVPAVLFAPTLLVFAFLPVRKTVLERSLLLAQASMAVVIGVVLFLLLKSQPVFSQLFSRGNDFLFPWREVMLGGMWRQTMINIPTYTVYFLQYLTPAAIALIGVGLFFGKVKKKIFLLVLSALAFILPIALFGKVVYPRYFVPAILPLTIAASLALAELLQFSRNTQVLLQKRVFAAVASVLLLANTITSSLLFIFPVVLTPDTTPFVPADVTQYLTEWSSGHGLKETISLMRDKTKEGNTLAVATEGFFGTLPDGLLLYLHNRDVSQLMVQGIGQPVFGIPEEFITQAAQYDTTWLVVNSHRMKMETTNFKLVAEFCRPYNAPCLQVWELL
ncbi:MAG: phospholipid carrier-dependent glycosyltransferase [Candidatus Pacebacteria bacterium]|nr:phospholipid carrier-dependent glycosyltransferase [Candidatus Paceibacterota bacterium]PIR60782.1 MAG: hypothetical protein COU67_00660 [Candidatus Pacebacteria bacterium CG10_big_fil_rev_8_21_14_0_10_44_54]